MPKVKTSVAVEAVLFARIEKMSAALQLSRSEMYERALREFMHRSESQAIKEKINAAQASLDETALADAAIGADFLGRAARTTMSQENEQATW